MSTRTVAILTLCSLTLIGASSPSLAQSKLPASVAPAAAETAANAADERMSTDARAVQNAMIERILRKDRETQRSICKGC